ncbi:MAG: hypothetical protein U5L95_02960 [Candidatus Saccharibacteria bacterium]|nr:hypothetical protein [Candidatus Saccharibacteria bacterium]
MNQEKSFINNIDEAVNSSDDLVQLAENLAKVDIPERSDLTGNSQILADYISEFQFDWDNEAFDNEEGFASETVAKTKQILADTKSGNQYKKIFSAELAYSRLKGDSYSYKVVAQNLSAKSVNEAIKEKDEIRDKVPRQHPEDNNYVLEDVRVRVKIVDQNENTVLEEKFLLN